MDKKVTFYVRAKEYRGAEGFHIGSRGQGGFGTSIFVKTRDGAERVRDALKAEAAGHINDDELWAIEGDVFDAERAA